MWMSNASYYVKDYMFSILTLWVLLKIKSVILIDFVQCIRTIKGKRITMLSVIITVKQLLTYDIVNKALSFIILYR